MPWFRKQRPTMPTAIQKNISSVAELEQELARRRTPLDRISDTITNFTGSMRFIIAHLILFSIWFVLNTLWLYGPLKFDPYPFTFLNLVLGVEAVLLGTFVLMSQSRQNRQADLWLHVLLQVGLLSEQETTKTLQMLQKICQHLGLTEAAQDKELKQLIQTTQIEALAEELEQVREQPSAAEPHDKESTRA